MPETPEGWPAVGDPAVLVEATRKLYEDVFSKATSNAHVHQWDIIGVWTPPNRAIHPRDSLTLYTVVLIKCNKCGWPETINLEGIWSEDKIREQTKGEADGNNDASR